MKKKSTLIILLVAVFVLLAVLLGLGLFAKSPQDRFQRQLSLGDRYYAEMDYDRAFTRGGKWSIIKPRKNTKTP